MSEYGELEKQYDEIIDQLENPNLSETERWILNSEKESVVDQLHTLAGYVGK